MRLREKLVAIRSSKIRTLIGVIFFFTYLTLIIIISLLVDIFLAFPKAAPILLSIAASVPILIIGILINLWSTLYFIKAKGTPSPFNPPPKLVTSGPYAYIRHPQGTSWFIIFVGLGVLFQSISLLFIFMPLFILLSVLNVKKIEEPELEKRFGNDYIEYKKKVPMFIPRLKMRTKKRSI